MIKRKMLSQRKIVFNIIIIIFSTWLTSIAEEGAKREGFRLGLNAGIGQIKLTLNDAEREDTNFFLGFEIGYAINSYLFIGIELSGWLYEASDINDPSRGEGLSQVLIITHYYPSKTYPVFIKIGGGYISHWNNSAFNVRRKQGLGITIGAGYDLQIKKNWFLTPFLIYGLGNANDQKHKHLTIGAGFTWYKKK